MRVKMLPGVLKSLDLENFAEAALSFALGPLDEATSAVVHVERMPSDAVRCLIDVQFPDGASLSAESEAEHEFVAIERAADICGTRSRHRENRVAC